MTDGKRLVLGDFTSVQKNPTLGGDNEIQSKDIKWYSLSQPWSYDAYKEGKITKY